MQLVGMDAAPLGTSDLVLEARKVINPSTRTNNHGIRNMKPEKTSPKPETSNPNFKIPKTNLETRNPATLQPAPKTCTTEPKIRTLMCK